MLASGGGSGVAAHTSSGMDTLFRDPSPMGLQQQQQQQQQQQGQVRRRGDQEERQTALSRRRLRCRLKPEPP